ncbi:MAG: gliding motility-associated C-terminal domain-containing protein [Chitinophagaceae bacterium]|nr:gliding motility-associated C-terminal domain-containing protein [Chitinophagaceae bacterium]
MRKFLLLFFLLVSVTTFKLSAQSCFNVAAGNDTTISCLQQCLTLKARIPDLRTTETYQVLSIPYTPYAYTTPGGTTDPLVNADDHFSDSFFLPFPFCFYGRTYTKLCVGSNGVITFDVKSNANTWEGYFMDPGDTIWFAGNLPDVQGTYYAPRAGIFLAYYDMNPATSPAGYKIEWRVEGTAPCRRFVVSYFNIGYYDNGPLVCPNNPPNLCTMQAVLYEGSGIIDVFYENKPLCPASQNGLSIAGIQNWEQNQAVTPAGKNGTAWSARNEGYRYVPSGATSLLDSVAVYKNGTWITSGTTVSLGNGELEATFPNICQSEDSMSYVVRAFYRQCDNPAVQTEGSDTIIVYKTLNPLATTVNNVLCNGGNGTVTVNSPTAANIEYSINGGASWQTSPVFNVPAGTYTVQARIIGAVCGGSTVVTVTEPPVLISSAIPASASCANNDGTITVTAGGGTPAYQYSINNGVSYQAGNVFNNLPVGNYNNIKVKDANGCISNTSAILVLNDTMRLELGNDSTICFGNKITLLPQTNPQTDTFKWTPAAGLDYDTAKNPVASPNDTTKYYLTAKWGVCQRTDSITINVKHKPVADAGKDTTICYKTNALLVGNATNLSGTVNYLWSPPDSLNTPNAAITVARIDTTRKFTLTVTDNYGCNFSVSDSMWVYMMPPLVVFAGNDTNAIKGRPHQLLASGGSNYVWSPAGPLNNPFIANPLATLYYDTYFTVTVTDAIGCTDDDDVFIKVYEGPNYYVPNAFSPNGDGLNDIFRPIPVGIQSTTYFRVFDRFGSLMFETNKWMDGWDGMHKGKKASSGTYVWMIKGMDKNGRVVEMQGTVILLQ